MAAGEAIGLLLVLTDAGGISATTTGDLMAILVPDEIATGVQQRIWAEGIANAGNVPLDAAPQITIWHLDTSGTRTTDQVTTNMTASGEAYYYDWTPSADGVYVIQVAGLIATVAVFNAINVTARAKFAPIGLAVSDVLVERM